MTADPKDFPPLKPPRVVLGSFPERYSLPARPTASAAVQDAHRQTGFVLGQELATFESAMNLQLRIVAENSKARARAPPRCSRWARAPSRTSRTPAC